MVDKLVLTESLTWIDKVHENPYVIRGVRGRSEVVGFFDPRFSSHKEKYPSEEAIHAPYRYVWSAPAIHSSFLASVKDSKFLSQLVEDAAKVLSNFENDLADLRVDVPDRNNKEWMKDYEPLAPISKKVFETKAKELKDGQLPVDYYEVSLLNLFYGPGKTNLQFVELDSDRFLHYMANLSE